MKIEGHLRVASMIPKLKHGVGIFSLGKWVTAFEVPVSVVSVLGVAGLVLALRDGKANSFNGLRWWLSSGRKTPSEEIWILPGLQNLGNNCFLNVILQALASCLCFQSYLYKIIDECGSSLVEGSAQGSSVTVALACLLEELCTPQQGRKVLSPRKVMFAMDHYLSNFNLTSQQDAEEALLHLLSSLREEISKCLAGDHNSLADVATSSNYRIVTSDRRMDQNELERWKRHFGPFDGILGSSLTCQSCTLQISLDFEFFHSLHLSPVLRNDATIMAGCTVEHCLKQFVMAEKVDYYHCSQCWHIAAMKYLSSISGNETDIEKLRCCSQQDLCDCRNSIGLEELPWSNSFSRVFKQLSIARSPKVLCIHLQRVSMNGFGELVKLQGHISFPLILDLSSFMSGMVGVKEWEDHFQREQPKQQYQQSFPFTSHFITQFNTSMINCTSREHCKSIFSEATDMQEVRHTAFQSFVQTDPRAFKESNLPQTDGCPDTMLNCKQMHYKQVGSTGQSEPSKYHLYRLVSVVEHFGMAGSGHYLVYRRVRDNSSDRKTNAQSKLEIGHWVCISDSVVCSVSVEDVLAAEASLLFYEKVTGC